MHLGRYMTYSFKPGLIDKLRNAVNQLSETQQCFVLLGQKDESGIQVTNFYEVPNRHEEPDHLYRIMTNDIPPEMLDDVVGTAHTHRAGQKVGPTYDDVVLVSPHGLGVVVNVTLEVTVYNRTGFLEVQK